ncbi:MAG TPA: hypothetical protein DCO89_02000 [Clostridiales bacterium]|nr:hypothetical protein [Clostridiales bacterium]
MVVPSTLCYWLEKLLNASKNALKLNNFNKLSTGEALLTDSCDLICKPQKNYKVHCSHCWPLFKRTK